MAGDGGGSLRCFAADVVAATLDPPTGRTLVFNHTPIAAWAGHLCDLVLCGALVDSDGVVTAGPVPPGLHPLVHEAFVQLQPALPRAWRWTEGGGGQSEGGAPERAPPLPGVVPVWVTPVRGR